MKTWKYIVGFIICIFVLGYLITWNDNHINLNIIKNNESFEKHDWYIVETIKEQGVVTGKRFARGGAGKARANTPMITVRLNNVNMSVGVKVSESFYDTATEGVSVTLERKVYYTLTGLRLFYRDNLLEDSY